MIVKAETSSGKGDRLFDNHISVFCRGEGGWGGERGPDAERADPPEGRTPDFRISEKIANSQNALYRLSGDLNPLHIDPGIAKSAGFERPILHGLCSFGYMGRAVLKGACGNDVKRIKEIKARFSNVVFPGETLTTEGWDVGGGRYVLRVTTERAEVMNQAHAVVA
jgi:acyl dehydratase